MEIELRIHGVGPPSSSRVPTHCRENRENGQKIPCQGKHREFGNLAKTQGIWIAQLVNSLILKDILVFAVNIS